MKKFTAFFLTVATGLSVAAWDEKMPPGVLRLPELCQLETDFGSLLFESQSFDVLKINSLDSKLLKMVNRHLQNSTYSEKSLNLAEIKELFSQEYSYDELFVTFLKHRTSGKQYVYVYSYPGDNEYGLYFSAETGEVVASNGDGSIYLQTANESVACYGLMGH